MGMALNSHNVDYWRYCFVFRSVSFKLCWTIWPTVPEIHPNAVGSNKPLDIPFSVTNKSVVFDIEKPVFNCAAFYIHVKRGITISNSLATVKARTIPIDTTRQQTCAFQTAVRFGPNAETIAACIGISVSYEKRWFFPNVSPMQMYQWHPELNPKVWLPTDKCD